MIIVKSILLKIIKINRNSDIDFVIKIITKLFSIIIKKGIF